MKTISILLYRDFRVTSRQALNSLKIAPERLGKTITIHTNSYEFVIKYIPLEYISRAVLPKRKPKTDEFSYHI